MSFKNENFEILIEDILNDAFYVEGKSKRGIIKDIRQYSEVVLRKMLNIPESDKVTLGNQKIVKKIDNLPHGKEINDIVNQIRISGNDCTHTQKIAQITAEEVQEVKEDLLKLISYLFVQYFEKYKFGQLQSVIDHFSLLPPIIRMNTLKILFKDNPTNIALIDKLALATLKTVGKEKALDWLETYKESFEAISSYTEEIYNNYKQQMGEEAARFIVSSFPKNIYEGCKHKIVTLGTALKIKGHLYESFEEAKKHYLEVGHLELEAGHLEERSSEIKEFNELMDFVYLGRKIAPSVKSRREYQIISF